VGGDIAAWIGQARSGDWHGAWLTLTRNNPFPAIAGRVCHHPCEAACNRGRYDAPLAVCALERHAGDVALERGWRFGDEPLRRRERIAVVGGGPSGLSAAYQLRRRGYAVTVLEQQPQLGGLLRHGIPSYRLPRRVLDAEIARVLELGIEVRTGVALERAGQLAQLRAEFDAVYLAIGARRQKRLAQLAQFGYYTVPWVMDSATYLARSNAGEPPALGRRLVVIGGGSAAMDVARSAVRAGHEVTVLALERESRMPAQRDEVVQAREEGVALLDGAMLRSVGSAPGGLSLACVRVEFEPHPFRVTEIAGSEFELAGDAIVCAIGQDPDLAGLAPLVETDGMLIRTDARHATSLAGVYAGGDVASTARFVTHAIGAGKEAARRIDCALQGEADAPGETADAVPFGDINTFYFAPAARARSARLARAERLQGYDEVERALEPGEAHAEAVRCFSCGNCLFCDNCFYHCPDMAVRRVPGGYSISADYCKGCGLCVQECPTGSIAMQEDRR
jgi:NADPH-dependent glutamate synthase beta subunit-like oxidoreductase